MLKADQWTSRVVRQGRGNSGCLPCRRIPSDSEINRALQFASHFCHPASIQTRLSLLGRHNWSQISGVPDEQMALYGIAAGDQIGDQIET
jgi:hypothetical protein